VEFSFGVRFLQTIGREPVRERLDRLDDDLPHVHRWARRETTTA
jgi:hypothetical protein